MSNGRLRDIMYERDGIIKNKSHREEGDLICKGLRLPKEKQNK